MVTQVVGNSPQTFAQLSLNKVVRLSRRRGITGVSNPTNSGSFMCEAGVESIDKVDKVFSQSFVVIIVSISVGTDFVEQIHECALFIQ